MKQIERYYRIHSKIYDATRWSFLFGRQSLIENIYAVKKSFNRILEVGCGTGENLAGLCRRFPDSRITALDLSSEMLVQARKKCCSFEHRIDFCQMLFDSNFVADPFDLVVFSYSLSMMHPGRREAIQCASKNLAPEGIIAVVDFSDSPYHGFKKWMRMNHVYMDGHLIVELKTEFIPKIVTIRNAYSLWYYLSFIGKRREED